MVTKEMLRLAQSILDNCLQDRKARARLLMKRHQRGEGFLRLFDDFGYLSWPASDGIGSGTGFWTASITDKHKLCECFDFVNRGKDCKHLILLARLVTYWHEKDLQQGG